MPTLFRFVFFCASVVALVYGAMFALVTLVEPRERDVTVRIPSERVNPREP
ncbi:histidine kinase [Pseudomonas sp. R2.Fl]|nr:histidine kinase [Pseudomonas sp. R2.Fl]